MSSICAEFLRGLDFLFCRTHRKAHLPEIKISCVEVETCWIGLDFDKKKKKKCNDWTLLGRTDARDAGDVEDFWMDLGARVTNGIEPPRLHITQTP